MPVNSHPNSTRQPDNRTAGLRAKFRNCSDITAQWEGSTIMTAISIGNHQQDNERFGSFVDLVNHYGRLKKVAKLMILVSGYLQRHYVHLRWDEYDEERAIKVAKGMDDDWLERNRVDLDRLTVPVEVVRWDELSLAEGFEDILKKVMRDYAEDPVFTALIDAHEEAYVGRKIKTYVEDGNSFVPSQLRKAAMDYMMEECASYVQMVHHGFQYFAYPGGMPAPGDYVLNKYFPLKPLKYLRYEIRRIRETEPEPQPKRVDPFTRTSPEFRKKVILALNPIEWNTQKEEKFLVKLNLLLEEFNTSWNKNNRFESDFETGNVIGLTEEFKTAT